MDQAPTELIEAESMDAASIRRCVMERLRFEQSLGVEFLPRVKLAQAAPSQVASLPAAPVARAPIAQIPQASARAPAVPIPAAARSAPVVTTTAPLENLNPLDKEARWTALEARALACTKCVLHQARTHVVFGSGNRNAQLVFVGEGPGQDEDLQGLPFVGKAGQLLNKIIAAMNLKREDVYICNVVKCRPPGNRTPLPDEISACNPYLAEQLELIGPKAIVALGGPAAKTLLHTEVGITKLRGTWQSYKSIPVMPTFHPAFVLRTYTDEVRRQVWDDMKKVMAKLTT